MAPKLTIIIPAKYEEDSINSVVHAIRINVKTPHQIIIVNDSDENDQTTTRIKKHATIRIIRRINPRGTFASALKLGFESTTTPVVVPVMADSCDDTRDIDRMYKKIIDGYDLVSASRYMNGGKKTGGPAVQSFFSLFVCKTLKLLTGIPTSDISNAFKMYKTSVIKKMDLDETGGVEVSMRLAIQAYYQGARIGEIPTHWRGRTRGTSKFKFWQRLPKYLHIYLWALRTKRASPQPATLS